MREFKNQTIIAAFVTGAFALLVGFMSGKGSVQTSQEVVVNFPDSQSESLSLEAAGGRIERLSKEVATTTGQVGSLKKELAACQLSSSRLPGYEGSSGTTQPIKDSLASEKPALRQQANGFDFFLKGCRKSGSAVSCDLAVVNRQDDRKTFISKSKSPTSSAYYVLASRFFDQNSSEYLATSMSLANQQTNERSYGVEAFLVKDAEVPFRVSFEKVSSSAKRAARFFLNCRDLEANADFSIEFQDVLL